MRCAKSVRYTLDLGRMQIHINYDEKRWHMTIAMIRIHDAVHDGNDTSAKKNL
jgi:hypothetical protein